MVHVDAECTVDGENGRECMFLACVPLIFFQQDIYRRIIEYNYARPLFGGYEKWTLFGIGTRYSR